MEERLSLMLRMQLELQKGSMKDGDPGQLEGDDMATFMTWNFAALVKELSEATDEIGWKPWGTNRDINYTRFIGEMVDSFHFFMNMLLCAGQGLTPDMIAEDFTVAYIAKNAVNAKRQQEGYDGMAEKCGECHRSLDEVESFGIYQGVFNNKVIKFCTKEHYLDYGRKLLT